MMPARRAAFIQDDPMLMHTHEARLDALRKQLAQDGSTASSSRFPTSI
jgi:hypothetical protein